MRRGGGMMIRRKRNKLKREEGKGKAVRRTCGETGEREGGRG